MNTFKDYVSFILDPVRDGNGALSALWKVLVGTNATVANSRYTLQTAANHVVVLSDCKFGRYVFSVYGLGLTAAQTPTNLNANIEFGLFSPAKGYAISFLLDKAADLLKLSSTDSDGNTTTTNVVWRTIWNANNGFRGAIEWYPDRVVFVVNGEVLAQHRTGIPRDPLNIRLRTFGTDTLSLSYIEVQNAHQVNTFIV